MTTGEAHTGGPLALGFPGQGGDWRAGIELIGRHGDAPLVRELAERLGSDDWDSLDPLDTRNSQPVVYVAGLVAAEGVERSSVTTVIGHSLGEITGSAWAGAIDPVQGLDLVVTRAALGHASHDRRPGAMAAFMRGTRAQVEWLRREVLADQPGALLEIAVVNSPTQLVLSGDESAVTDAVDRTNAAGGVARRLPIGGAFHSPLMVAESTRFRTEVAAAVTAPPAVPLVSSTACRAVTEADDLVDVLVRSLVLPVDWPATVAVAREAGAVGALDAGPGDTLVRLARFLPGLPFTAVSEAR
ncbi:ACP S-malonyltransferase [Aquihabitans daechungensis]|uniref:ACP S-malonyltransferase n=1 Tax=Aquihabitans daechungensis TaxID=1052257 RepID=UPI003B9F37E7